MSDSESESGSGSQESESESEMMTTNYGSDEEPSEDDNNGRPPSKRSCVSDDKDVPMFMRLEQDGTGRAGGQAETRHIQRKLRKQKKGETNLETS